MTDLRLPDATGFGHLLTEWLPRQRWFGGKGRPIHSIDLLTETVLSDEEPRCHHVLLSVDHGDGRDRYQLLVGLRQELPQRLEHVHIGELDGWAAYDAAHDNELTGLLLEHLAHGDHVGSLAFHHLEDVDLQTGLQSIVMGAEQSNTSIVYGEAYILKLFRKVAPGLNPDLEITRVLALAGCTAVVPPLAWYDAPLDGETTTLAMCQPFLRSATEGWALAVTSVRDLYAEADLHADEVGGDFAGESERLGVATAEVHMMLRELLPSRAAEPEEIAGVAKTMHERLDAAVAAVPELAPHADDLRSAYEALMDHRAPVVVQRVHGDFHLGQVLRTDAGWVLLDFEGEPARALTERTALMSPLRDVAGMLRSFDYAARHLLADHPGPPNLEYRAVEWAERNREAFCDGYARASGQDPREEPVLLRAFELDKAVYEVVYEARNRPTWLRIPLASIERLVV